MTTRTSELIALQDAMDANSHIYRPLREYLADFFSHAVTPPDAGYARRPALAIRLPLDSGGTVAIRPGWKQAVRQRAGKGWQVTRPGEVISVLVEIEFLAPKKLLCLRLTEDGAVPRLWLRDPQRNKENLKAVAEAGHALLLDPLATMAGSGLSDNCRLCGRGLTDAVSRSRGVGPECVKCLDYFTAPPLTAVEQYRLAYYRETGFWPGR